MERRYGDYTPGVDYPKPAHWSDNLQEDMLWADVSMRFVAKADEWAQAHGVPVEEAKEAFRQYIYDMERDLVESRLGACTYSAGSEIVC